MSRPDERVVEMTVNGDGLTVTLRAYFLPDESPGPLSMRLGESEVYEALDLHRALVKGIPEALLSAHEALSRTVQTTRSALLQDKGEQLSAALGALHRNRSDKRVDA